MVPGLGVLATPLSFHKSSSPQDLPETAEPRALPAGTAAQSAGILGCRQFTCSPATSPFHGTHRSWGHRSVTAHAFQ